MMQLLVTSCHPEALLEYFGLECCFAAFWPEILVKCRDSAIKTETSREILRPKEGLGMTVSESLRTKHNSYAEQ